MSMNRNDALGQLASGLQKFEGHTAGQVLDAQWPGLKGLPAADLAFFEARRSLPVQEVARACQGRSRSNAPKGIPTLPETDALIHLRVPAGLKARWVRESRDAGQKLTDWIVQRVEAVP